MHITPNLIGYAIGSGIGIYLLSLLVRYALLGKGGTKAQHLWVVTLTGIAVVGLSAFGDGTNDFANRITNPPDLTRALAEAFSTLIVGFIVLFQPQARAQETTTAQRKPNWIGRSIAMIVVVPMLVIGFGNLAGSGYSIFTKSQPDNNVELGVSRSEMRQIMLNGDMAQFWRMIDDKVPTDLDYIISRIFDDENQYTSEEDVKAKLDAELLNYRLQLAIYGPALSDIQRQELLGSQIDFLKIFVDDPEKCAIVASQGGAGLSQEELISVKGPFNSSVSIMMGLLIDARIAASEGVALPKPPSENDYTILVSNMIDNEFSEVELQVLFNERVSDPAYCKVAIGFMDAVLNLQGAPGEAVRFEVTQGLLTTAQ